MAKISHRWLSHFRFSSCSRCLFILRHARLGTLWKLHGTTVYSAPFDRVKSWSNMASRVGLSCCGNKKHVGRVELLKYFFFLKKKKKLIHQTNHQLNCTNLLVTLFQTELSQFFNPVICSHNNRRAALHQGWQKRTSKEPEATNKCGARCLEKVLNGYSKSKTL